MDKSQIAFFSVDRQKSLDIFAEILTHFTTNEGEKEFCIHHRYKSNHYGCEKRCINSRHKLAIVELEVNPVVLKWIDEEPDPPRKTNIGEMQMEVAEAIAEKNYSRSDSVQIYSGTTIENGKISMIAHLHGTQAECDVSFPEFTYDEMYSCWLIKDDFWGAAGGIDDNGIVTILDFSEYFDDK